MTPHPQRYRLELSGGLGWEIDAGADAAAWLERFAAILQLPRGPAGVYPELIVTRKSEPGAVAQHRLRESRMIGFYQRAGSGRILCEIGGEEEPLDEYYKMWELLLPVYEETVRRGGMPLHAALLERDGVGVLLAAAGGTGKTTCSRRAPPPWRALSDDECLILPDGGRGYRAHPLPTWSEFYLERSSPVWDVGRSVPLAGVFFLRQSAADAAAALGAGEAALRAYDASRQVCQGVRMTDEMDAVRRRHLGLLDNAAELARRVPAFSLDVALAGSFWVEIARALAARGETTTVQPGFAD